MATEPPRSNSPEYAATVGREALARGEITEALRWLGRAHRLVPDDPTLSFLYASSLCEVALDRAIALLQPLTERYPDFRDARVALLACYRRAGRTDQAADELSALLRRLATPIDTAFYRLATDVSIAFGAPGWVGFCGDGRALIGGPVTKLEIRLDDGDRLQVPPSRRRQSVPSEFALPASWIAAHRLNAAVGAVALLGSGVELQRFRRVNGYVERGTDGGISGCAWLPAAPGQQPTLRLLTEDKGGTTTPVTLGAVQGAPPAEDLTARAWTFRIDPDRMPDSRCVRIVGPDGHDLWGSPILPAGESRAARAAALALAAAYPARGKTRTATKQASAEPDLWRPLPVSLAPMRRSFPSHSRRYRSRPPMPVDIIVPIYRGAAEFQDCLRSVLASLPDEARLIIVDDAAPDRELLVLAQAAEQQGAVLLRHRQNRGFPAAVNTGLRHALRDPATKRDVVLLNSDTIVPPGWLQRLSRAAWSTADTGSVTPLTGDGSIVSYPSPDMPRPDLSAAEVEDLDRFCQTARPADPVDLPTAVGFCMYIRHDCLEETGLLREDAFAQGYGEENDWCLRARQLGWRHVALPSVFVQHRGGVSFGAARTRLMARNADVLNRLHPGYDGLVKAFVSRDPLANARARIDRVRWRSGRSAQGAVILISHGKGGGVDRHVAERCIEIRAQGLRPIIITPAARHDADGRDRANACSLVDDAGLEFPNLRFALPEQLPALIELLRGERPKQIEIHHLLGHDPSLVDLSAQLSIPQDVVVHDYGHWCPRVTLCGRSGRYCGEPLDIAECEACISDLGAHMPDSSPIADFRKRSARMMSAARRVVVSCNDVARRLVRHFPGIEPTISAWEDDTILPETATPTDAAKRHARVAIVGAIGPEKGYDVLLNCARDAARRDLPLEFVLIGHSSDDARLLDTGRVFVTGRYVESEALALLRAQRPVAGFLPSVWPETWCYALSILWRAGLPVLAFGLGAQEERIRQRGLGWLLPLGLAESRINDVFLERLSVT